MFSIPKHAEFPGAGLTHIKAEVGLRTQRSNNKTIRQHLLIKSNEDGMSVPAPRPIAAPIDCAAFLFMK